MWTPAQLRRIAEEHELTAPLSHRPEFHYRQARIARQLAEKREAAQEGATAAKGESHGSQGLPSWVPIGLRASRIVADPFAAAFDGLGDC